MHVGSATQWSVNESTAGGFHLVSHARHCLGVSNTKDGAIPLTLACGSNSDAPKTSWFIDQQARSLSFRTDTVFSLLTVYHFDVLHIHGDSDFV